MADEKCKALSDKLLQLYCQSDDENDFLLASDVVANLKHDCSAKAVGMALRKVFPNAVVYKSNSKTFYKYITKRVESKASESVCTKSTQTIEITEVFIPKCFSLCRGLIQSMRLYISSRDFATTYRGKYNNLDVCIKQYNSSIPISEVLKEVKTLVSIPAHKSLNTFLGMIVDRKPYLLFFNFFGFDSMPLKNTLQYYYKSNSLSGKECLQIGVELAEVVSFIHSHCVVHNDISFRKILLFKRCQIQIKLIDFRCASILSSSATVSDLVFDSSSEKKIKKTPEVAPEIVLGKEPTDMSDVYGIGFVIGNLCKRKDNLRKYHHVLSLLSSACNYSPSSRPNVNDILDAFSTALDSNP